MEKNEPIKLELLLDGEHVDTVEVSAGENATRPRLTLDGKSFIEWHRYGRLG